MAKQISGREQSLNEIAQEHKSQIQERQSKVEQENNNLKDRRINFNSIKDVQDIAMGLENNLSQSIGLSNYGEAYQHWTEKLRESINREDYHYMVARWVKVKHKFLCFNGHPTHELVYEKHFNQLLFDNDSSNSKERVAAAETLHQELLEAQNLAQENLNKAIQEIKEKTENVKQETNSIISQNSQNMAVLSNISQEQGKLQFESDQHSNQINTFNNRKSAQEQNIATLPAIIASQKTSISSMLDEKLKLEENSLAILENLQNQEQELINKIKGLTPDARALYIATMNSYLKEANSEEEVKIFSKALTLAKKYEFNSEILAYLAIEKQDCQLLQFALTKNTNCETTLVNNKSILQAALNQNNNDIINAVMQKIGASGQIDSFVDSIVYLIEINDDLSLARLAEKLDSGFLYRLGCALEKYFFDDNFNKVHKIIKLFPQVKNHSFDKFGSDLLAFTLLKSNDTEFTDKDCRTV